MSRHCLILLAAGLLLAPASVDGADWTQFRGPDGSGVSPETDLPVRWSKTENMRWTAQLPGKGIASPVIVGGKVFITICSGPMLDRLHVLCFEVTSGKQLWERRFLATGNTMCHEKTTTAAPTPITDGRYVYALFGTGDLVCLTIDGDLIWYRALLKDYPNIGNSLGLASSPVLAAGVLVVPLENVGDSFILGLDAQTGVNRWKMPRPRELNWVTPLVLRRGDRSEVIFQTRTELTAYDPMTGKEVWTYKAPKGLTTSPSPVGVGDAILVLGGDAVALRPGDGGSPPQVVWQSNRVRSNFGTPLVDAGRVYTISGAGVLVCARTDTGALLWQERLKGTFYASLVLAAGRIYAVNDEGKTFVVQVGDKPQVLATNSIEELVLATPAVAEGAIFLRGAKTLYCIGQQR